MSIEHLMTGRAIQLGDGPIRIDPDDKQFAHRGTRIAIKIRDLGTPFILACRQMPDSSWTGEAELTDMTWLNDGQSPDKSLADYGNADEFVRKVVLPPLNAWLATVWAADGTAATALEQIQAALQNIRFAVGPDGTVTATLA